jgi:hypothetical protein
MAMYCATRTLQLLHADLCGSITPLMPGGKRLFLLIIDDMSSCMWLVLLAAKDEVTMVITHFRAHVGAEAQYRVVSL